jgi:uncharacterized protein
MPQKPSFESMLAMLRRETPLIKDQFGVDSLEVFGSYVRNEQNADSDLDLLVSFRRVPSLFGFMALENHLTDVLGVKVDLVMKDTLKPSIGRQILSEAIPV